MFVVVFQDVALNNHSLTVLQKINLHSLVIVLLNLISNLLTLSPLQIYARQVGSVFDYFLQRKLTFLVGVWSHKIYLKKNLSIFSEFSKNY